MKLNKEETDAIILWKKAPDGKNKLNLIQTTTKRLKQEVAMHTYNYSIWGVDSGVQGQPRLQSKFVDKLSYGERAHLKKRKK